MREDRAELVAEDQTRNDTGETLPEPVLEETENEDEEAKKSINWRNIIIGAAAFIIILAVTLIFLRLTTEDFRFKDLPRTFMKLDGGFIALGFLCLAGYVVCEGRAMAAAGRAIGVKMTLWRSVVYSSTELFFSALTPSASGGQPAAAYYMSRDGIKLSKSSVILLNNTMHYTISLLVMSLVAIVLEGPFIFSPERGTSFRVLFILGFIANIAGFVCCLLFIFAPDLVRTVCTPIYRLLAKMHIIKDLDKSLASFEKSVVEYGECQKLIRRSPFAQFKVFLLNIAQRMFNFAIAYCVYRALGHNELPFMHIIVIQIMIVMAVNALPLPGAVGASETIHKQLYLTMYISKLEAVHAMLFTRFISFYSIIIICGVISIWYYINVARRKSRTQFK